MSDYEPAGPREPTDTKRLLDAARALVTNPFWLEIIVPELNRLQREATAGRNDVNTSPAERETWLRAVLQSEEVLKIPANELEILAQEWESAGGRR